jgi:hypothetical protein
LRLLSLLDGDLLPLPACGDLERQEQGIAIAVCQAINMTPERWDRLDDPSREAWLERTLEALTESPEAYLQKGR